MRSFPDTLCVNSCFGLQLVHHQLPVASYHPHPTSTPTPTMSPALGLKLADVRDCLAGLCECVCVFAVCVRVCVCLCFEEQSAN